MLHARKDYRSIQPLGNDPSFQPTIDDFMRDWQAVNGCKLPDAPKDVHQPIQ